MEKRYIESTNLETAQRLALLILEKEEINSMTIDEVVTRFISDTKTICSQLDEEYN